MFKNRTSSQKPGDDLYQQFKQNFPQITVTNTSASPTGAVASGTENVAVNEVKHETLGHDHIKDLDPTPRANHEAWRFTPSMLDVNSFAFHSFANQPPGYYTPTPGGTNTLYHNQAGDLHTPGMGLGMGLGTPLSGPASDAGMHAASMMDFTYGHAMAPLHFHDFHGFGQPSHSQAQHAPQSYAPSTFVHQDTGYETMEHDGSPVEDDALRLNSMGMSLHHSPVMQFQSQQYEMAMDRGLPTYADKFRFHITLNAPTAMIKHADEIPVTYLNKGQAYSVSIVDTMPALPIPEGTRYRSFIRISFEDEQQRQKPATCWQLWKEGRGTNEAHQRGGKLQAVEYVEANQPADNDDKRTRVELDTASFDGFSVVWTPGINGTTECNIAVRFNFLSTDFSHSKGVKGIPVRLCAKTEEFFPNSPPMAKDSGEVAFCKVKLFRDHGAERKLSNDVAHVKKTIDKLKQQISQSESGLKDFGKRKRTGSIISKTEPSQKPGKVPKHKRTWSMSSASSSGGRPPLEEDLHYKLQIMQDMFTSTRPVSILYLRGDQYDDPDLHPVALVGEPLDLTKADSRDNAVWQERSGRNSVTGISSLISPSPSSSLHSQGLGSASNALPGQQQPDPQPSSTSEVYSGDAHQLASPPDQVTRITKQDGPSGLSGWIEALGVDTSYKPPVENPTRPVACFYVKIGDERSTNNKDKNYYRAVYLVERSLKCFEASIASKWNLASSPIIKTIRLLAHGLEVEVDDDVIRELSEGQDMIVDFIKITPSVPRPDNEWDMAVDTADAAATIPANSKPVEEYILKLMF